MALMWINSRTHRPSDTFPWRWRRWTCAIEKHYGQPMDIEWAKDGETGKLYIVQARPETVQSRKEAGALKSYQLKSAGTKLAPDWRSVIPSQPEKCAGSRASRRSTASRTAQCSSPRTPTP
ncbi:MAG: PEP/pyruvate-binding domain-containing protein, partial [Burkholderiales bacterium]